jgi:hypothetical protein
MLVAGLAARLREITGSEEEWISRLPETSTPRVCHELLARCLDTTDLRDTSALALVHSLTLAERDWLLLQLQQRSFGKEITGEVRCPSCQTLNEIRFAAGGLVDPPRGESRLLEIPLTSGSTAMVRPLTAGDHEHFAALVDLEADAQVATALSRLLSGADGTIDVSRLTAEDRREIVKAIEATAPDPIELQLACSSCEVAFTAPLDLGGFVIAELLSHSRTLIDDVHTLATTYHWSESDVLGLPLQRRIAYLTRIDADCDRALVQEVPSR